MIKIVIENFQVMCGCLEQERKQVFNQIVCLEDKG